jgi:DNA-binding SARP family transcriptional activator/tetratricopeptide (TPR) repeat protein
MAQLRLTLFGGFEARQETGKILSLPSRKAQALLAYLALPLGRSHPRDKLAALLWGGIREESARASLRQVLFVVRKALGGTEGAVLRQEGEALALIPAAVEVDVATFERAVREGTPEALARAAALYRGDLLAGSAVDEAPFEEWLIGERERLRELALEGLAKLLAHQRRGGATEAAIGTALRLLTLDPLQEVVHRTLMRLYAGLGRRGTALRQYQQCVSVLGRELGVEPEAETKQLYQEILRQRPLRGAVIEPVIGDPSVHERVVTSRTSVAEIALIGRAPELKELRGALERACAGQGSVVAVLGEAGIGKTRLLSELIETAEAQGARVLVGRSYESEQVLPFGPWVDAFRTGHAIDDLRGLAPAWRAELAHLLPELTGADIEPSKGSPDFLRVFEGVTGAISMLAGSRPLLLVLEDLHWADEMSVRLLAFLGRRLHALRVLVAVTIRQEELADAAILRRILDELQREGHLWSLPLPALSRAYTLELVHTLARSGSDETDLARLGEHAWDASAGNPFVVVETVRSQAQGIGLSVHPGTLVLSEAVRQLVTRRLERLSERGRLLTTVAAVIGREFEFALLQRAAGLGDAEAAEGVEELVRRRVLQGVGERFDFAHDRIREVARAELLAPRRRVLHRGVAEAIEAVYAEDLEPHILALGLHYHGAELWPQAMSYLRRAAVHAFVRSAHREAATCFEHALAAVSHLPRTRETLDQMLELQLQMRAALWPLAEFDRIARCLEDAERLAISLEDQGRLGRIAAFTSVLRWVTGDAQNARRFAQRARDVAVSLEDQPLRAVSNYYLGLAHFLLAEYQEAEVVYRENLQMLTVTEQPDRLRTAGPVLVLSTAWLVLALAERGAFVEGLAHGRAALDLAETAQDPFSIVSANYCLAYLHCLKGEHDPAVPLLERALALCQERDFGVWLPQVTGYLGYAYSRVGRIDEGRSLLERAIDIYEETRAWPFRARLTIHRSAACLRTGRLDEALALGHQALTLAREHGERGHEAWALRLLGEIASRWAPLDAREAGHHYHEALAMATTLGMHPLVAHCHLGLGHLSRRTDEASKTREHLTTAATMYRDMGMGCGLAQAEAALGEAASGAAKHTRPRDSGNSRPGCPQLDTTPGAH